MNFTILEEGSEASVDARIDGDRILVPAAGLEAATGWFLKPQGLCRHEICVPVPPSSNLLEGDDVDLAAFAGLVDRPVAADAAVGVAFLGESARERSTAMRGGEAPDFTLPDLSGREHSLGDYRGRKALLIAWASW